MFQLLKTPVVIAVSLLAGQTAWADDNKRPPVEEALLNNAASYLNLTNEVHTYTDYPTQEEVSTNTAESGANNTPFIASENDGALTLDENGKESIYPLGMTKQQYIDRLKMLEDKRDSVVRPNTLVKQNKHNSIDELIARIEAQQVKERQVLQTKDPLNRTAPHRLLDKTNRTLSSNTPDEKQQVSEASSRKSLFSNWFKSSEDERKNDTQGEK
jgi:hypothetical protein